MMGGVYVEQTKDISGRKLTPAQLRALRAVVATNGGGVSMYDQPKSVWQSLINRGLVQGKLNHPQRVVHTKEGLALIREMSP